MNASERASALLDQVRTKLDKQPHVLRDAFARTFLGEDCDGTHPTAVEWSVWGAIQCLTGGDWDHPDAWSGHIYYWQPKFDCVEIDGHYYDGFAVPSDPKLRETLIAAADALERAMTTPAPLYEYEGSLGDGVDVICWLDAAIVKLRANEWVMV